MAESIQIQCPKGHLLALDVRDVGKHVQCPVCKMIMVVPASHVAATVPAGPAPTGPLRARFDQELDDEQDVEDDEQDEWESGETPKQVRRGLKKVRTGLNYHIAKLYVLVIAFLVFIAIVVALVPGGGNLPPPGFLVLVGLLAVGVGVTAIVLDILTFIHLSACPAKTQARGLVIAYVMLEVMAVVLQVLGEFIDAKEPGHNVLLALGFWVGLAGYVCFVLVLKRLALFVRRKKLAAKATGLLVLLGVSGFCLVLLVCGTVMVGPGPRGPGNGDAGGTVLLFLGGVGLLVAGIWSILRYLRLIHHVRDAL